MTGANPSGAVAPPPLAGEDTVQLPCQPTLRFFLAALRALPVIIQVHGLGDKSGIIRHLNAFWFFQRDIVYFSAQPALEVRMERGIGIIAHLSILDHHRLDQPVFRQHPKRIVDRSQRQAGVIRRQRPIDPLRRGMRAVFQQIPIDQQPLFGKAQLAALEVPDYF